ncbi:MAG: formylmethanofuran dehydrogenase subunit A [Gammaproteobacteria bacterium]|nr:formylmethanofuran dehydrogenase subunit A [Gammaproteobacteria bacterium]
MIKLEGGRVYDPVNGLDGKLMDLYIEDGKLVKPAAGKKVRRVIGLNGSIVMAGGIDIHTHIGGGKVSIARLLLAQDHDDNRVASSALTRSGSGSIAPSSFVTGYRYAEMGYTTCFEPAMMPVNARQSHLEMADTPMLDTGAYALLGNDDFLLRLLNSGKEQPLVNDYVAWTIHAARAMGIKVVNPGGISAFKFNQRKLDLDEKNNYYEITPRNVLTALLDALEAIGVPHPLHVHGCNLGVPGNYLTTLETIAAAEGRPLHLTHVQFHSYGAEGDRKFSSAAAQLAEAVNLNRNVSIDVGQIMFGQTVTTSADSMMQHKGHIHAHPKKWVCMDIECDAGCGVVPFRYRDRNFVNALQWCIGLEIFLLVKDPWRIFLTTDHPNGAPFTSYPHLIRLLMDKGFRNDMLTTINKDAADASILSTLDREYSLYEIAIITRAAPARSLGLRNHGHLGTGATADITVYKPDDDAEAMFATPEYVFKRGELCVRNGKVCAIPATSTHVVEPEYDPGIEKPLKSYFDRYMTMSLENFKLSREELESYNQHSLLVHDCKQDLSADDAD